MISFIKGLGKYERLLCCEVVYWLLNVAWKRILLRFQWMIVEEDVESTCRGCVGTLLLRRG